MYQSFFSYNLSKPYPYRWFTWVVLLGGFAFTALFSVINVAANGYELTTTYTTNPNETEQSGSDAWYQKKPWSYAAKVRPFCQDQTFLKGSVIRTNNTRINYKVSSITIGANNQSGYRPSFAYHNDYLRDCEMTSIRGTFSQQSKISAVLECIIYSSEIATVVGLTANFGSATETGSVSEPNDLSNQTHAALWWAQTLARHSLDNQDVESFVLNLPEGRKQNRANLTMRVTKDNSAIADVGLYNKDDGLTWFSTFGLDVLPSYTSKKAPWRSDYVNASSVMAMDATAKALYSFLMTDLGQSPDYNLLNRENGVVDYLSALKKVLEANLTGLDGYYTKALEPSDYAWPLKYNFADLAGRNSTEYYTWARTGVPMVYPASFNAQYTCLVPKLKSTGALIVNVVIGDLVMLQALFVVFNLIVRFFLERKYSDANLCADCGRTVVNYGEELNTIAPSMYPKVDYSLPGGDLSYLAPPTATPIIRRRAVGSAPRAATNLETESTVSLLSEPQTNWTPNH